MPLDRWLRSDLREWGEALLSGSRLTEAGYFNTDIIWRMWNEHQSGARNWRYALWNILRSMASGSERLTVRRILIDIT